MTYSCAVFERDDEPLADAQRRKLRLVCDKLELGPDDHVLEIGCGWGSFALTAAGEYGARVTGLTLSPAQAELARRGSRDAGLDDRMRSSRRTTAIRGLVHEDRVDRDDRGDRRAAVPRLLLGLRPPARSRRPGMHPDILIPDHRWRPLPLARTGSSATSSPGCLIPSLGALTRRRGLALTVRDVEEIGLHYARDAAPLARDVPRSGCRVRALGYDEHFVRTWDFYLASCEALFRARLLATRSSCLTR